MEEQLPKNWVKTNLENLFNLYYGKGLSTSELTDEGFDVYGANGIIGKYSKYSFENSKIIISCRGAASGAIHKTNYKSYITSNSIILDELSKELINLDFVKYVMASIDKSIVITGTAQPQITIQLLKYIQFPLAPLAEQNRIAKKLDTIFAQLERIKTRIKNLKDISNRFTYSCLVDSKNNKFHEREKIGQYLEERTDRIGANWKNLRLIGVSAKEGITNLRIGQKESFEKYKIVRPGDFIYNTMRVNIGSIAIYDGTENALTSPDYVVFNVSKHLSPRLLLNFLKSDQGLLEIGANTKGSVRARLYFKALSEVRMPIAPIKIQNFAETFLKGFNSTLNSLNTLKETSFDKLSPSILAKAVKGELVPQLDSDGHASELLLQIQELKGQSINTNKK
ncbi:restriction endonuclease subunit S [Flavobacterium sp. LAR06]|uniref:restriction endonuclease subunit S n=1 Tax=Flavobacterium sp. LAR06 TaxID=3064897 RepID=UPI0035C11401